MYFISKYLLQCNAFKRSSVIDNFLNSIFPQATLRTILILLQQGNFIFWCIVYFRTPCECVRRIRRVYPFIWLEYQRDALRPRRLTLVLTLVVRSSSG